MFDKTMFRGLSTRLAARANIGSRSNPYVMLAVVEVAAANYPKGARADGIKCRLPPCASQNEIWQATENYVDRGSGSLDDLFRDIWGLGFEEYVAAFTANSEETESIPDKPKLSLDELAELAKHLDNTEQAVAPPPPASTLNSESLGVLPPAPDTSANAPSAAPVTEPSAVSGVPQTSRGVQRTVTRNDGPVTCAIVVACVALVLFPFAAGLTWKSPDNSDAASGPAPRTAPRQPPSPSSSEPSAEAANDAPPQSVVNTRTTEPSVTRPVFISAPDTKPQETTAEPSAYRRTWKPAPVAERTKPVASRKARPPLPRTSAERKTAAEEARAYGAIADRSPDDMIAQSTAGFYLQRIGNHMTAAEYYTKAIKLGSRDAIVFRNRAMCYRKLGLWDSADTDSRRADSLE